MDGAASSWFFTRLAHWRAGALAAVVIFAALILNLTVLGANPVVDISADPQPAPTSEGQTVVAAAPAETVAAAPAAVPVASVPVDATDPLVEPAPVAAAPVAIAAPASPAVRLAAATRTSPAAAPQAPQASPTTAAPPTTASPTTAAPTTRAPSTTPPSTTAPATIAPATTVAATTTIAPTTAPPTTTAPATTVAQIEYPSYTVEGGVGSVVLVRQGNSISLYGFYPNSGWVHEVERNGPTTVKLKFFNVQTEKDREWKATVQGGQIQVEN